MKITLLAGTNRPGSNTRKVVAHIEKIYRGANVELSVLDLAQLPDEIFKASSYAEKPASFARFADLITKADGVHIVTPEYNGGFPGVLKYFVDMLPHPQSFTQRPVVFTGLAVGMWGALRPVEQLQTLFTNLGATVCPQRVFLPGIGNLLSDSGEITDEAIAKRLTAQVNDFVSFVGKLSK
ncbi:MAG: NAD(P)H-dependent oxidoreductase [Puniceicoccales bacterium]|jgi:NAD(P)H-dependent FMN reductase|nr:NAD(P)H-dependent oxidoreductase [Puniceicoccales bacterium]